MPGMPRITIALFIICIAIDAFAQSSFEVDLLDPAPAVDDLLSTRSPHVIDERVSVRLGSGWCWHLFGIRNPDDTVRWIVRHRLDLWGAVNYSPTGQLRLAAGFSAAAMQQGTRKSETGADVGLAAAMGESWLAVTWAALEADSGSWLAGLQVTLGLPSASRAGLCGDRRPTVEVCALYEARLAWLRLVANLGLATRTRTLFYDLTRDDTIVYRLGAQAGGRSWPFSVSAELSGQTLLQAPFEKRTNDFLESLFGVRLQIGPLGVTAGAGIGLLGAVAPTARAMLIVDWEGFLEKSGGLEEYE